MSERSFAPRLIAQGWSTNRIVAIYVLIGSAWILLSDQLVVFNTSDAATLAFLSTLKGLGYVAITAALLHGLISRYATEMRESAAKYRTLYESMRQGVFYQGADGRLLEANAAALELFGLSETEFIGRTWLHPAWKAIREDGARLPGDQHPSMVALRTGQPVIDVVAGVWNPRLDDYVWLSINAIPEFRAGQTLPYRVAVTLHDITDRKRAEDALRANESLLRAVVDNIPLEFWARDQEGRCFMENAELVKHWGSLLGTRIEDNTVEARDVQIWTANNMRAYAGQVVNEEVTFMLRGECRQFQNIVAPIRQGDTIRGILGLNIDITERKQHERELEAIAAIATALRTAAARDEMGPVIVSQVRSLIQADGAALIKRDAATGEAVIVYGEGVDAASIGLRIPPDAGIVGHVIASGRPYATQDAAHDPYVFRPDLANELQAVACAPLIAQDQIIGALWVGKTTVITDEETRLLVAISDIAANALYRAEVLETLEQRVIDRTRELAEANDRLKELDRLKSKFVSDVSHELRTPITALMLNVELLEHGKPEKREHYLQVIRQQTLRQMQLIEDILNLSRLELSTTNVQFVTVNVNVLIEQAVNVYRASADAANLQLSFTPEPSLPTVSGVESHLSQVVTNLIANAINYTPAGSVDVTTHRLAHEVLIEVRDTGLGIAPEDVPHLFERFYRGKLTWQVRGTGLGLAIVKEITEAHRGHVEVDSVAGVGSTFRVYLPIA
ncbi:MAG: ATP-binding protein [Anaerolineae bacterium]